MNPRLNPKNVYFFFLIFLEIQEIATAKGFGQINKEGQIHTLSQTDRAVLSIYDATS